MVRGGGHQLASQPASQPDDSSPIERLNAVSECISCKGQMCGAPVIVTGCHTETSCTRCGVGSLQLPNTAPPASPPTCTYTMVAPSTNFGGDNEPQYAGRSWAPRSSTKVFGQPKVAECSACRSPEKLTNPRRRALRSGLRVGCRYKNRLTEESLTFLIVFS